MATYPQATIVSTGIDKLSNQTGANMLVVTFMFDADVLEYRVNVSGTDPNSGIMTGLGYGAIDLVGLYGLSAGTVISVTIEASEMYQEGNNRVNIYGKGMDGTWTPYEP